MSDPGYPLPGESVTTSDYKLRAYSHRGFPGVLLGVQFAGEDTAYVDRAIGGTDAWEPVRTGWPVRLNEGMGEAYDLEALPGVPVAYRVRSHSEVFGGLVNPSALTRTLTVTLPQLAPCEAWLKHLGRPSLSRRVVITEISDDVASWLRSADVQDVAARFHADAPTSRLPTGSMTFQTRTEADYIDLERLLRASGPLLLQAGADYGLHDFYFARTGWPHGRPVSRGWGMRTFQVGWEEIPRPDDWDQPPVIPGWTWDEYTAGRSLDHLAQSYRHQRDLMVDGIRQWEPVRGGLRGRRP